MRCPACASVDDKVVDSRQADDGSTIRRRRQCLACGRRFTTFERIEEVALSVLKRSGAREPFDRAKVAAGVRAACLPRPLDEVALEALVAGVEDALRLEGRPEVTSEDVGRAVLDRLPEVDPVAAVRFASVYKGFEDVSDFEREITELAKRTAPKPPDR
jgi:transcriptional repressor NrdR